MILVSTNPIPAEAGSSKSSSSSKSKFSFFSSSSKSSKPINNAYSVQDISASSSQSGAHTSSPNLAAASLHPQHQQSTPSPENPSALVDSNGKDSSSHRYVSPVKSSELPPRLQPSSPITKSQSVSALVSDTSASGQQQQQHSQHPSNDSDAHSAGKSSALGSPVSIGSSGHHSAHPSLPGKEHQQHPLQHHHHHQQLQQSKSGQLKSVNMPLSAEETQLHCKWHSHYFALLCFLRLLSFLSFFFHFCCRCRAFPAIFLLMLAYEYECFVCQTVRPFRQALSDIFSAQVVDILIQSRRRRRRRRVRERCNVKRGKVTNYICAGATFIYYNLRFIYTCYRCRQRERQPYGERSHRQRRQTGNGGQLCASLSDENS